LPERGLRRGQVGTIEQVAFDAFEVEFIDEQGRVYARAALLAEQLMALRYSAASSE
jgi:hypothetical protein